MNKTIDNVLSRLNSHEQYRGKDIKCHCPAHDDNTESLSVTEAKDGKVLIHCHAGCDTDSVLAAVGLTFADLSPDGATHTNGNGNGTKKRSKLGSIIATYDYTDEQGTLLYQATRHDPKDFRQRQPDGKGGWIASITTPPVRKVLYRLPELMAANLADWVYLVEGEKDADNLRQLGVVATCNAMGAGKWDAEYTKTLTGRRVCILPDYDLPGQQHATKVMAALKGKAAEVIVLNLPGLSDKEDASDWIERGGTLAELQRLTQQMAATTTQAQSNQPSGTGLQSMSEMLLQALGAMEMTFKLNRLEDNIEVDGKRLDDVLGAGINLKLIDQGFSRPNIADGITVLAGRNTYHPVEDYLLGLTWDGHNHLRDLMDCFTGDGTMVRYGGQDVPLHASLIGRWMTGAAARALETGSNTPFKHQTPMLVIIGDQGIGKSSFVRYLASGIGYEYHRESMVNPHGVEDVRSMVTKWIWEVSELASSLRRSDRDSLKAFITQEWHTYRKPWGKHPITKPTLCNFVGTLNRETGFLDDPTGNRRFLPVVINAINHGYKDSIDVNQVWAQVVSMYRNGQTTPELNQAERVALQSVYKEHEIENPLATYIGMYFDVVPSNEELRCHTAVILQRLQEFGIKMPTNLKVAGRELNDVLAPMGLKSDEFRVDGVKGRGWIGIAPNAKAVPS
jgi:predicted P-loop ATPase